MQLQIWGLSMFTVWFLRMSVSDRLFYLLTILPPLTCGSMSDDDLKGDMTASQTRQWREESIVVVSERASGMEELHEMALFCLISGPRPSFSRGKNRSSSIPYTHLL